MENGLQAAMLQCIYGEYETWVKRFDFACAKGCSACCTRNVNMTFLEGRQILDFLQENNAAKLEELQEATHIGSFLAQTTNEFARSCLNQIDVDEEDSIQDYSPCVFLENGCCAIYAVRPFGCRSFGSRSRCEPGSSADMASLHLTVNMIVMQIIEHLDREQGFWGNMIDVLQSLHGSTVKNVLPAHALPGMLVPPEEGDQVREFLVALYKSTVNGPASLRFGDVMMEKGNRKEL